MAVEPTRESSSQPCSAYLLPPSEFFGALPTRITRTPASTDPDTAVAQTIALMSGLIQRDAESPTIRAIAARGYSPVLHAFWYAKRHVRFVDDQTLLKVSVGIQQPEEFLISPARLVTMPRPRGDCDDFTMLVCSLLLAAGVDCEMVTIAADPNYPREFSHVYAAAVLPDGLIPLDASHAPAPGYEAIPELVYRKQYWPVRLPS